MDSVHSWWEAELGRTPAAEYTWRMWREYSESTLYFAKMIILRSVRSWKALREEMHLQICLLITLEHVTKMWRKRWGDLVKTIWREEKVTTQMLSRSGVLFSFSLKTATTPKSTSFVVHHVRVILLNVSVTILLCVLCRNVVYVFYVRFYCMVLVKTFLTKWKK